jgi:polysaccharide export outer membrane protein
MLKITRFPYFLAILLVSLYSCTPYKKIQMFKPSEQDTLNRPIDESYRPIIEPNDVLDIYVTSTSPEASKYFNYSESPENTAGLMNGYLVDLRGEIQIPFIGSVKVSGLNSADARDTVARRLSKYLVSPSVKLSIRNFKVTVLGEVSHPGIYTVQNEKLTLPEALALAGDFTIFSKRDQVLIIRDSLGYKTYSTVSLNNREVFASANYTLHSNDIVYVEPNKKRRFQGENYYRIFPIVLSSITFILSVIQVTK